MKQIPSVNNPAFGIITPTTYLEQYASQSNFHLVLAHLVDTDVKYAEFYRQMSDRGDFLIMDNGAFELGESYEPSKLIGLAQRCGADAIVLPDYPGKPGCKTIDAAVKLIDQVKAEGFMTFFCPQSAVGDFGDWIDTYMWASNNPDIDIIGMSILAIPNALPEISKQYARIVMTRLMIDRGIFNFNKYHHYLGLNSPNEIPSLVSMEAVTSLDSSNPVWCGINGLRYNTNCDSYMPISKKYLREVDFNQEYTTKSYIHEAVQHNLDIVQDMFINPSKYL